MSPQGALQLENQWRARHGAEQGRERLPRLEVERPVLHLDEGVAAELAVEWLEFVVGLPDAIGVAIAVDEGAPHDHAAVRGQGVRQHLGPVGVRAAVLLRAGLSLGIRLDQEAAEVGNLSVDLGDLARPPGLDVAGQRVVRALAADLGRRAEPRREIHGDTVRPEGIGQGRHLVQVRGCQDLRVRIDVGKDRPVDADGRVGAGVVLVPLRDGRRQGAPAKRRHRLASRAIGADAMGSTAAPMWRVFPTED